MEHAISAADASRDFSALLRSVHEGNSFLVTNYGKPVARIVPADQREAITPAARDILLQRLAAQTATHTVHWSRDELYEDEA